MATIVITGGAGFLGSHLCDRFMERGDTVVCIDNLITGSADNVATHIGRPTFHFLKTRAEDVEKVPVDKVDAVLHFGSLASPEHYLKHPLETLSVGSEGTRRMLELARQHQARFLLASTSEVYGDPEVHPQQESYWGNVNPNGLRSCYDESKRYAEALTMAYHRQHGVASRIVRIFNTYGPRMVAGDGRVIPNFIMQALHHKPLTVYGEGHQTRSFCYYRDLIDGILALLERGPVDPVNIGNPEEYTMLQLAEVIKELTDSTSSIEHRPLPADDPKRRCPDISRARELLGWQPKVPLREGLLDTIAWFRQGAMTR
ncbi:MAG: UDP-glucuronic acid decarboxylase family protein [Candidatus Xenobia bacterium]